MALRDRSWKSAPVAGLAGVATLLLSTHLASAADGLASADVDARYAAISASLEAGEGAARLWWFGWTGGYAALTVGEAIVAAAARDEGTRVDAIVGLSGSALGVGAMLFSSRAGFAFRGRLSAYDPDTLDGRRARLREAEKILDEAANDEESTRAWYTHVAGDAVTLAGTFVLWAGYHEYANGWLNLIGGTLVTEAQILTKPTAAIRARRAYRAGTLTAPRAVSFTWSIAPALGGVGFVGTFR
jgi:hypothetical protein